MNTEIKRKSVVRRGKFMNTVLKHKFVVRRGNFVIFQADTRFNLLLFLLMNHTFFFFERVKCHCYIFSCSS